MKILKVAQALAGLTEAELREVISVARALPESKLGKPVGEKVARKTRRRRGLGAGYVPPEHSDPLETTTK